MPDLEDVVENGLDEGNDLGETRETAVKPEKVEPADNGGAKDEEWKAALAKLTDNVTRLTEKKPEPKEETPEQRNAKWAVFEPEKADKEFFKKFFKLNAESTPEEVQAAKDTWALMQNGLMKQAIVGAMNVMEQKYAPQFQRLDALEEWRNQASAKELRSNFNETYPALADPIYADILKLSASELANKDFASHEEYFQALAERAAKTIKGVKPDFDLGAKPKTTTTSKPKLPRTSVGGTGGAGGAGKASKDDSGDDSGSLEM